MGSIMGSQKIMGSDYGSNISVIQQQTYHNFVENHLIFLGFLQFLKVLFNLFRIHFLSF
jgi:hypothetical protein